MKPKQILSLDMFATKIINFILDRLPTVQVKQKFMTWSMSPATPMSVAMQTAGYVTMKDAVL